MAAERAKKEPKDTEGALLLLRDRFLKADERWPNLHHGQLHGPQGIPPLSYFNRCLPPLLINAVAPASEVVKVGSGFFGMSIYWDTPPVDAGAVTLFHDLAICACRCIYGSAAVDEFPNRNMYTWYWPAAFEALIYREMSQYADPILHIRRNPLVADESGKSFSIGDMYKIKIPKGLAVGSGFDYRGKGRNWKGLLQEYVRMNTILITLEQGVFRVAARVIQLLMSDRPKAAATPAYFPNKIEIKILSELASASVPLYLYDLEQRCGRKRATLGKLAKNLANHGFIYFPRGERGGYFPTDDGRAFLDQFRLSCAQ